MKRNPTWLFLPALLLFLPAPSSRAQDVSKMFKMRMSDTILSGAPRRASDGVPLSAGPLRLTFQDGELRYLSVGDTEVVRRIYFAVRDPDWDTAMPEFSKSAIHIKDGGFEIDLAATCKTATADYTWKGEITGTSDGTLTFHASGAAGSDFASPRIGLCVLYWSPVVAGRKFETVKPDGTVTDSVFPVWVTPQLVAPKYETLRYTAANGTMVRTTVFGALFDMEDQRTYSDSSFKAYAPLTYPYPNIRKGVTFEETVTIKVENAPAYAIPAGGPLVVRVGALVPGAKMPKISVADSKASGVFGDVNGQTQKYRDAKALTWGFNPTLHLPDDATYFENVSTIVEQVKTARSYAPEAVITIDPVSIDSTHPRPVREPRNKGLFAAAWSANFVKYAAIAGVDEVKFQVGEPGDTGFARTVQKELGQYAGHSVYDARVEGPLPLHVDASAIDAGDDGTVLYLINRTGRPQTVTLQDPPAGKADLHHFAAPPKDETIDLGKSRTIQLSPLEVCRVRLPHVISAKQERRRARPPHASNRGDAARAISSDVRSDDQRGSRREPGKTT